MDDKQTLIAKDAALIWAEQQEEKRASFEREQERKRQDFEAKLERSKAMRDWMMLIITFAAVGAAYWTGWEARHARIETGQAADKSLKLEQQPYIFVSPGEADVSYGKGITSVSVNVIPVITGKTPATRVEARAFCKIIPNNRKAQMLLDNHIEVRKIAAFAIPGKELGALDYQCTDFDSGEPGFKHADGMAQIVGEISYHDIIDPEKLHAARFCFNKIVLQMKDKSALRPCPTLPADSFH